MPRKPHHEVLDIIRRSIEEDDDTLLSEPELRIKEELLEAFGLMMSGEHTMRTAADTLHKRMGLPPNTCLARLRDAKDLFGGLVSSNRQVDAALLYMRAERLWQDAEEIDKPEARINTKVGVLNSMIKIKGVDRPEADMPDPSRYEPHEYHITLGKPVLRELRALIGKGALDLAKIMPNGLPQAHAEAGKAG